LFYNTGIPACLWFLRRERDVRKEEILFIDASEMGFLKDRVHREFTEEDIAKITATYHNWCKKPEEYEDIKGYCKSAARSEVEKHGFVLTPGRYVGIVDAVDDGIPFEEKIQKLTTTLKEQFAKEELMNEEIKKQLAKIGFQL
jgi:type I restriction enzyme M protein